MVTRIDRLARSIGNQQDIVRTVRARGSARRPCSDRFLSPAGGSHFWNNKGVNIFSFHRNQLTFHRLSGGDADRMAVRGENDKEEQLD
jgi:hypothetical protein